MCGCSVKNYVKRKALNSFVRQNEETLLHKELCNFLHCSKFWTTEWIPSEKLIQNQRPYPNF